MAFQVVLLSSISERTNNTLGYLTGLLLVGLLCGTAVFAKPQSVVRWWLISIRRIPAASRRYRQALRRRSWFGKTLLWLAWATVAASAGAIVFLIGGYTVVRTTKLLSGHWGVVFVLILFCGIGWAMFNATTPGRRRRPLATGVRRARGYLGLGVAE